MDGINIDVRRNPTKTRRDTDVLTSFHFYVEFEGVGQAVFTEVTGMAVEVVVQEYEEGGRNDHVHRLPGRIKVSDITLKNGITLNNELLLWFQKIMNGDFERKHVSIIMVDQTGQQRRRWNFKYALPVKWTGPELKAGQSQPAIQSLQLAHRGVEMVMS